MSRVFTGEYSHNVDTKGRIIMPAKFRKDELGEVFYVTKGIERCLFVYSREGWAKFEDILASLPSTTNRDARMMVRFFSGNVAECEVDKLGRINIPLRLREHAGLVKDVKVVGVQGRVEIWDSAEYEAYCADEMPMEKVISIMDSFGMDF